MRHTELPVTCERAGAWRGRAPLVRADTPGRAIGLRIACAMLALIGAIAIEAAQATTAAEDEVKLGAPLAVPRHVIAGGGGRSSGGVFAIQGTIGQPEADPLGPSTGGVFAITGGLWPGTAPAAPAGDPIFASGFEPAAP
jgi:hypothetical protein